MIVDVTAETFEQEVLKSTIPVVVDFYAPWCAPCKVLAPKFQEASVKYEGKFKFVKCDVETAGDVPQNFSIFSVPTVMVFIDGVQHVKASGIFDSKTLDILLNKVLAKFKE